MYTDLDQDFSNTTFGVGTVFESLGCRMATSLLLTDAPLASSILGVAVVVVSSKTPSEVIGDVAERRERVCITFFSI